MSKNLNIKRHPTRSISLYLILTGLFFLPFNSYEGLPFLGEFVRDSAFIFFVFAFFTQIIEILVFKKIGLPLKHPLFIFLIIVLLWFFLTFILNIYDIKDYYLKFTSGPERFMRQYVALLISAIFFLLTYYNVFKKYDINWVFLTIRKVFFYSFVIVSIYTFIEIAIIYFNQWQLQPILYLFDYFPFCEVYIDNKFGRISSVTYEPPSFAEYLMTIAGWMFSYIITHKGFKYFIPGILVVLFAFLSGSRSGLAVILVQLLVFILYFIKKRKYHSNLIKLSLLMFMLFTPILMIKGEVFVDYVSEKLTSFELKDSTHSTSNKSRFGMIYTSGVVFSQNPIKGVGFGQMAYEARPLYPSWATKNNWEFKSRYLNDKYKPFPPSYNLYARIMAETGIIGFSFFIILLFTCVYISYKKMFSADKNNWQYQILLISFIGFSFNWLQIDTFRTFGFWICLALLILVSPNVLIKKWKK